MRTMAALAALFAAGLAPGAGAQDPGDVFLGELEIPCAKDLRIIGRRSTRVPRGKYEWVSVPVADDLVVYECGFRRSRLVCPIGATRVRVQRAAFGGKFRVQCFGEPHLVPGAAGGGEPFDAPDAEGGTGETPAVPTRP